jgi:hypothetical protein
MSDPGKLDLKVMKAIEDYPPGLVGTIAALFGRCIAASHGVDWTLDVMIAEAQCEFFRRFDSARDRVWGRHRAWSREGCHHNRGS